MARAFRRWLAGPPGATRAGLFARAHRYALTPSFRVQVRRWRVETPAWSGRAPLRIAVLSDLHMGRPLMSLDRLDRLIRRTNALGADLTVILGDLLNPAHRAVWRGEALQATVAHLSRLTAPLGVFAVLGNHDYRKGPDGRMTADEVRAAYRASPIHLLENAGTLAGGIWIAGVASGQAIKHGRRRREGFEDLGAAFAGRPEGAPAILLAHEPDLFADLGEDVAVTLSGHTHGGQVVFGRWAPVVPSRHGGRYRYGLIEEEGRHLVVSGGLGCSGFPIRLGMVPEITVVDLSS